MYSLRNRPEKLAEGSLFCLFLKLIQINLYLPTMYVYCIYIDIFFSLIIINPFFYQREMSAYSGHDPIYRSSFSNRTLVINEWVWTIYWSKEPFHTLLRVWVVLIIEDLPVKCRIAIKVLFPDFNLCLNVKEDSVSCSFTFVSFLTN